MLILSPSDGRFPRIKSGFSATRPSPKAHAPGRNPAGRSLGPRTVFRVPGRGNATDGRGLSFHSRTHAPSGFGVRQNWGGVVGRGQEPSDEGWAAAGDLFERNDQAPDVGLVIFENEADSDQPGKKGPCDPGGKPHPEV